MDRVTTHSASKVKKIDTSAPMEIGTVAGTGEEAFEGVRKILNSQCKQRTRGSQRRMEWRGSQLDTEILNQR